MDTPILDNERSLSALDAPHNLNVSWLYQIPIGPGKKFQTGNKVVDHIIGNWQINGMAMFVSGRPFTVVVPGDIANTGNIGVIGGYMRPNLVGNPKLDSPSPERWINTAAFAAPALFTFGNAGRNIARADGTANLDLSVFRDFVIPGREDMRLQFRAEAFNAFNTPQFAPPIAIFGNVNFGRVLATANTERQIQLGLKLIF